MKTPTFSCSLPSTKRQLSFKYLSRILIECSHVCGVLTSSLVLWLDSLDCVDDSMSVKLFSEVVEHSFLFSGLSLFKVEFVWTLAFTGTVSVVGCSSKIYFIILI